MYSGVFGGVRRCSDAFGRILKNKVLSVAEGLFLVHGLNEPEVKFQTELLKFISSKVLGSSLEQSSMMLFGLGGKIVENSIRTN